MPELPSAQRSDLGWALDRLREGRAVTRAGWNGRGMWLRLQPPGCGGMSLPFVYMRTAQGDRVPWLCSQSDLLACDWQLAEDVSQSEADADLPEVEPEPPPSPPLKTGPGGFAQAMQLFARGWDLRRASWPPERWVQHPSGAQATEFGAVLLVERGGDRPRDWTPTVEDVHASDWVIADLLHCRHCGESLWRHDPALSGEDPQRVGSAKCGGARRLFAPKERTP